MAISGPWMWPDSGALPRRLQVVKVTWEVGGPVEQRDGMAEPGHSRVCGQVGRCAGPGQAAWAPSLALPPPSRVSVGRHVSPFGPPSPLWWRGGTCALELRPVAVQGTGRGAGPAREPRGRADPAPSLLPPRRPAWSGPCKEPSRSFFNQADASVCLFYLISLSKVTFLSFHSTLTVTLIELRIHI